MLRILTYEEIDRAAWSALVRESETGTWFQGPEAYDFLSSMPELFSPFCIAVEKSESRVESQESRELRGVCVGYVTKERRAVKQFFTRRAIILGGPCLAEDCSDAEVTALLEAVKTKTRQEGSPIYIETRNFNDYSRWKEAFVAAGFEYVPHLNFHVDTSSVEIVEANLGKSRKRDIRTTIREGVTIIDSQELRGKSQELERLVHEYYIILKNLYETKIKLPLFPESFFQALAKHKDGRFLLTMYREKVIGGTVLVEQEGKCVYEWFACGEDGVYPHVFPSCYATYAGIKYAAEHGCGRFDMMGAGKPNESYGVRDFKSKFGGEEVEYGRFLHINNALLYRIGATGISLQKKYSIGLPKPQKDPEILPDLKEWATFVARHPKGTIFQTPEMYAVYKQTKNQQPMVVVVRSGKKNGESGKIVGLMLAVIQWNGGNLTKPLTARSIIIGGPLVEKDDVEIVREVMEEYQRRLPRYVIYSEIRPVYEIVNSEELIVNSAGWKRVGHYNLVLRTDRSEEELWNGMHKERRRNVGQAEKAGLRFEEVGTAEGREEVIALLQKTYVRKHVPMADSTLFARLTEIMPENVHFFAAYHEDRMIAGQIRLGYKELLYAWYAGSDEQYFKLRPNDFLMWNVIKWAHEKGYTHFDFGGGGEPGKPYGVRDYKLKYGCEMKDYGRWICVKQPIIYGMAKQMYAMLHKE